MDDFDYVIIGSGPSSTGFYLSEKFQKVSSSSCVIDTALDYNNILDKEPSSDFLYKIHDVNHKTYYGDKGATQYKIPFEYDSGFDMKNSYYLGGLTNVWGAACERYNSNELKKMGLSIEEEYYEKIEKHMHINNMLLPKKSKMRKIYTKLQRESNEKAFVTPAKLAVKFSKWGENCGGLYGNTSKAIFNSKYEFYKLTNNTTRILGEFVNKIFYNAQNDIKIETISLKDGRKRIIKTKNLIIGCGPINTAKLLLKSFNDINSIRIKDSQGFTMPIVDQSLNGFFFQEEKDIIELSNIFLKNNIKDNIFHGQLYFCGSYAKNQISKSFYIPRILLNQLINIIYLYQGYLPSEFSSEGEITLQEKKFNFKILKNYDEKILKEFCNDIGIFLRKSNLRQFNSLKKVSNIFGVYHFGSLSIILDNKELHLSPDSGLLDNYKGIHIIDASVLKNLPGGPITSTVMANALRIADNIL